MDLPLINPLQFNLRLHEIEFIKDYGGTGSKGDCTTCKAGFRKLGQGLLVIVMLCSDVFVFTWLFADGFCSLYQLICPVVFLHKVWSMVVLQLYMEIKQDPLFCFLSQHHWMDGLAVCVGFTR